MIEDYLIKIGFNCGTIKNFDFEILEDKRKKDYQHWYFLTPIKVTDSGNGLKEAKINMAYPFAVIEKLDTSEKKVIERLSLDLLAYETDLLKRLRQDRRLIVPPAMITISFVPFWANEKTSERMNRVDFGSNKIHAIIASLTIKYRESWITIN